MSWVLVQYEDISKNERYLLLEMRKNNEQITNSCLAYVKTVKKWKETIFSYENKLANTRKVHYIFTRKTDFTVF